MSGPIRHVEGGARTLEMQLQLHYIQRSGHLLRGQSGGLSDPGPATRQRRRSHLFGSGCRIRTDISSLVRAGVLPLDEPRDVLEPIARPLFP